MSSTTKRYLRDSDYKKAILTDHLNQLTRGDENTLIDAELDAKACIESMLSGEYEIENEFSIGEGISKFEQNLEYFSGDSVTVGGSINSVSSYKNPQRGVTSESYWSELEVSAFDSSYTYEVGDFVLDNEKLYELKFLGYEPSEEGNPIDTTYFKEILKREYSQKESYYSDSKVIYRGVWFVCIKSNGVISGSESSNIVQPIIKQWGEITSVDTYPEFSSKTSYVVGDRVEYDGIKYECLYPTDDGGMVQFPDYTTFWIPVSHDAWNVSYDYSVEPIEKTIVLHIGISYQLYNISGLTIGEDPSTATDNWRVVDVLVFDIEGRYQRSDNNGFYGFVEDDNITYFVYEKNEKFINFYYNENDFILTPTEDPRNRNITLHMVNIALYNITSVAIPDNVPESRVSAYEMTMKWLQQASDMKANPDIPRKIVTYTVTNSIDGSETEVTRETSKWALSTSTATRDTWSY